MKVINFLSIDLFFYLKNPSPRWSSMCFQYAYQEEQERPLHAPTTQCCKLAPPLFFPLAWRPLHLPLAPLCSVTPTLGKNVTGHVAEMRLMDEATRGEKGKPM